jgi:hypothetical protein
MTGRSPYRAGSRFLFRRSVPRIGVWWSIGIDYEIFVSSRSSTGRNLLLALSTLTSNVSVSLGNLATSSF